MRPATQSVGDARAASQKTRAAAEGILRTALVVRWQNAGNPSMRPRRAAAARTNAAIDASLRVEAQTTRLGKIKKI